VDELLADPRMVARIRRTLGPLGRGEAPEDIPDPRML
jgi:4-alpha-glucanotransferase